MSDAPKPRKIDVTWGPCKHGVEATIETIYGFDFYGNAVFEEVGHVECKRCMDELAEKVELGIPNGPIVTRVILPDYSDPAWDRRSE